MNKSLYGFILMSAFLVIGFAGMVQAEVNVSINIGQPREMVMMPTGIYFVADSSVDVFFYDGYWWTPRSGSWYRANHYKGPWGVVQRSYVPAPLFRVPLKNYRAVYKKGRHMNYGEWEKQSDKRPGKNRGGGNKH
jgi:hypothetical protein